MSKGAVSLKFGSFSYKYRENLIEVKKKKKRVIVNISYREIDMLVCCKLLLCWDSEICN